MGRHFPLYVKPAVVPAAQPRAGHDTGVDDVYQGDGSTRRFVLRTLPARTIAARIEVQLNGQSLIRVSPEPATAYEFVIERTATETAVRLGAAPDEKSTVRIVAQTAGA